MRNISVSSAKRVTPMTLSIYMVHSCESSTKKPFSRIFFRGIMLSSKLKAFRDSKLIKFFPLSINRFYWLVMSLYLRRKILVRIFYYHYLAEYDLSLRDSDKVKLIQQKAIELCELPKGGLSTTLTAKKKSNEIRYTTSPSKLCFMGCSLLNLTNRMHK